MVPSSGPTSTRGPKTNAVPSPAYPISVSTRPETQPSARSPGPQRSTSSAKSTCSASATPTVRQEMPRRWVETATATIIRTARPSTPRKSAMLPIVLMV